jgi:hypothetical protein
MVKTIYEEVEKLETPQIKEVLETSAKKLRQYYENPRTNYKDVLDAINRVNLVLQSCRLELSTRMLRDLLDSIIGFIEDSNGHTVEEYKDLFTRVRDSLISIKDLTKEERA